MGRNTEVHYARIQAGGYSSLHRHLRKVNEFYVISGTLKIISFNKPEDLDNGVEPSETITLVAGQRANTKAGLWHMFEALTDVELIETYWTTIPADIERHNVGGLKCL